MAERLFETPGRGTGGEENPYGPEYSHLPGIEGFSVMYESDDKSTYIALFQGDKSTLDEIAQKDDAIPLTEAEAGRRLQELQREAQEEGDQRPESGPSPPAMGQGSSIEERLEDFVENAVGSSFVDSEGGEVTFSKPVNYRQAPAFYPEFIGLLELDEMRRFPRYLTDVILRPESAVIIPEHYNYWLWTTNFVDFVLSNGDEFDSLIKQEDDDQPNFGFGGPIRDFLHTVGLVAFPRRMTQVDDRVVGFLHEMSGISSGLDEAAMLRLLGPNSLAILDALVKRRCSIGLDGNLRHRSAECVWRPDSPKRTSLNYHDQLQYWRHYVATPVAEDTLRTINELQRYDIEYLRNMGGVLGNRKVLNKELKSTNNFLHVVGSQRNYNLHGKGSASLIAPIVLNLCCLVFWDAIDTNAYEEYQEAILRENRTGQTS